MRTGVGQVGAFATETYKEMDGEIHSVDPREHPNQRSPEDHTALSNSLAFQVCTDNVDNDSHCTSIVTVLLSFPHALLAEQVYTASLYLLMLDNFKMLSASSM